MRINMDYKNKLQNQFGQYLPDYLKTIRNTNPDIVQPAATRARLVWEDMIPVIKAVIEAADRTFHGEENGAVEKTMYIWEIFVPVFERDVAKKTPEADKAFIDISKKLIDIFIPGGDEREWEICR